MSIFKKALVAAAALASVNAFAAVAAHSNTTTGESELILTVFDTTAKVSYILDLGVGLKAFAAEADLNRTVAFDGVTVGVSALTQYTRNWAIDSSAGSQFAQFLAASPSAANWRWTVSAADSVGSLSQAGRVSVLTTITTGATVNTPTNQTFGSVFSALTNLQDFYITGKGDAANQNTDVSANGSVFGSVANGSYAMADISNPGEDMAGFYSFGTSNSAAAKSDVVVFLKSGSRAGNPATVVTFDDAAGNLGHFSIQQANGGYQLNYTVGAVPEPGSYALMLAGLGAVGMLARRRRQA